MLVGDDDFVKMCTLFRFGSVRSIVVIFGPLFPFTPLCLDLFYLFPERLFFQLHEKDLNKHN